MNVIVSLVLTILLLNQLGAQELSNGDTSMQLVWHDEFSRDGAPDSSKWNYEYGFVRNEELQWYQPENAVVRAGFLVIRGEREEKMNPDFDARSSDWRNSRPVIEYTSSSLLTRGLHSWQYGRFEMRAKVDVSAGMWPAFWTLGVREPWPECGEIDIMEYYNGSILANAAWAGNNKHTLWDSFSREVDVDWSLDFHVWRMDWDEQFIRLYVDDELLNEIPLGKTVNKRGKFENPMKQPHYLILNLAIGGINGGDPTGTAFPKEYVIDYVRVYQKK